VFWFGLHSIMIVPTGSASKSTCSASNDVTGNLPCSPMQVYGSDAARAANLRSFVDGKMDVLNTPVGPMLPRNTGGLPNDNDARVYPDNMMFLAGGGCLCCGALMPMRVQ
jgi:hypothetical protein